MNPNPITPALLAGSVIAVPPLARHPDLSLHRGANALLIRHLEAGGVRTLLYGGNAVFYHMAPSEFAGALEMLRELAGADSTVSPSVGPAYGLSMDQAAILRAFDFPTAMMLPARDITTPEGVAAGIRKFAHAYGKPVVLYIKFEGYLDPEHAKALVDEGVVSWIKYAIVRADPARDEYLRKLVDLVDRKIIVSGIGEQPAVVHLRDFGVQAFTSGCVCVAPRLSMAMLRAIKAGDFAAAESIRAVFQPLEDLRNAINPIRVLHEAVAAAGIAPTGPLLPLLSPVPDSKRDAIASAAQALLARNAAAA